MNKDILIKTVARLVSSPKGILAIDESLNTCNKRFEKLGVPITEEKRREYRELLITAPEIEKYISGYILFDETIRQSTNNHEKFTSVLQKKGIDIGIKVDEGLIDSPLYPREKITSGLWGLSDRLQEYKNMGATFAKWRSVYIIGENIPTEDCMEENAVLFVKYAIECQELGIVPIIEPEVLMDGDHSIEKCYEVTAQNLNIIFSKLKGLNIFIPGLILKTNMIISGKDAETRAQAEEVAKMTIKCLKENVPSNIGGIVFLSGGQDDEEAVLNLNVMHKTADLPWPLTFSYGRAIQNGALKSWSKNPEDVKTTQALLLATAKNNSEASMGEYKK
ncbi:MAG: class I fructose-bisphosphate aldolase [Patescibacteria group bacterium]